MTGTFRCSPRRSGPDHLQRVSNGGRRVAGHGPWRPVSGNVRREGDLGRNLAIERFAASSVFSDAPPEILLSELEDKNPFGIWRLVDGQRTRA